MKHRPGDKRDGANQSDFTCDGEGTRSGLFGGLGNLLGQIARAASPSGEPATWQGELKGLDERVHGIFGVSVRMLGDEPVVERFGNMRSTARGAVVEEEREPLVDLFEEPGAIKVVAELPGVGSGDITWRVDAMNLHLRAAHKNHKYAKAIPLPAAVEAERATTSFRNGIFELTLPRPGAS